MDDHSNKRRMVEGIVMILKTALTRAKTTNPLGDLSLLPPEIRDEIYRHSIPKKKYYWRTTFRSSGFYDYDPYLHRGSKCKEEPIFCLSKAIKEEAMALFYLNGTFVFRYNLGDHSKTVGQDSGTNNMMNIELFYNASLDPAIHLSSDRVRDHKIGISYNSANAGPLDSFRGDALPRKSILIVLRLGEWWRHATKMTTSPLFDALRQLTGFETVTLSLAAADGEYGKWPEDEEWERMYTGFEPVLREMSISLEPTLGKSSAISELSPEEIGPSLRGLIYDRGIRDVVFHPRNHQAAISKAKKDELLALG